MNTLKNTYSSSRSTSLYNRNVAADTSAISVSQLNKEAKSLLENSFLNIRVQGELSNYARPASGHWYFTLKDNKAQIRCAMFKGNNRHVNFTPKEGDEVVVQAKVSLYEGRGDYQLICQSIEEAGSGRLQLAFEQLKAKLLKEGLFDSQYKKEIPQLIQHLAVITSPSGAAVHDVLSVIKRRFPSLKVTIYPSSVQGSEAAHSVIRALSLVQKQNLCDTVLITRGGGSLEDLWPFNEEKLARAIFNCPIPVISAVGHEVDFSICDLVADHRAATPSAAGELVTPDQNNLKITIDRLQQRLSAALQIKLTHYQNQLFTLKSQLKSPQERLQLQNAQLETLRYRLNKPTQKALSAYQQKVNLLQHRITNYAPKAKVENYQLQLEHLQSKLPALIEQKLLSSRQQLNANIDILHSVSPLATLSRGYSITQSEQQSVITKSSSLALGQVIINTLHQGKVTSIVQSIEEQ